MLTLTDSEIERFQKLWKKKYQQQLSKEQAKRRASTLIRQVSFFQAILSEHDK